MFGPFLQTREIKGKHSVSLINNVTKIPIYFFRLIFGMNNTEYTYVHIYSCRRSASHDYHHPTRIYSAGKFLSPFSNNDLGIIDSVTTTPLLIIIVHNTPYYDQDNHIGSLGPPTTIRPHKPRQPPFLYLTDPKHTIEHIGKSSSSITRPVSIRASSLCPA